MSVTFATQWSTATQARKSRLEQPPALALACTLHREH